jgi:hypothetical protein
MLFGVSLSSFDEQTGAAAPDKFAAYQSPRKRHALQTPQVSAR